MVDDLENRIIRIGTRLFEESKQHLANRISQENFVNQVFEKCMQDQHTKAQLLRFIDVLPSLQSDQEIVSHMNEYLPPGTIDLGFLNLGVSAANLVSRVTARPMAAAVKRFAQGMAGNFIAGENIDEAARIVETQYKDGGMGFSLDTLGERTTSEEGANLYMDSYIHTLDILAKKFGINAIDKYGKPIINVSIKLTSLYSKFDPIDQEGTSYAVKERLRPIFRKAQEVGGFVHVDSEEFEYKDIAYKIFKELMSEEEFENFNAGIVIQAYLKDSGNVLEDFVQWSKETHHPMTVRLVKGAYWDHEVMVAQKNNLEVPVFAEKWQTDANHEELTRLLLENSQYINPAIATHNIRTISNALAYSEELMERGINVSFQDFEIQMLYGMGNEIKRALVSQDIPVRVYTPFGDLVSGMGYFVRRLLENSSNVSFLRAFDANADPKLLLRNPLETGKVGVNYG